MQARHDALTSLPNRFAFNAFLASALKNAHTGGTGVVLIFLDIDHFKDVNDSLGHDVGDCLLHEVAGRLSGCVRAGDMVARYGGDEFVLVLVDMETDGPLEDTLERMATAMDVPVTIDDVELNIEASIGIARFPQDAREPETLLKQADLAMYRAKQDGRNCARHFNPSLAQVCDERVGLSQRLRKALAGGGFTLHYQPQVALAEERISGVEALLRWVDPDLGNISPARFIPLAEENGLIVPIGEWVIGEACRQLKAWDRSLPGLRMSVNVSPRQFSRTNLPVLIERVLADTGLHPGRLELEITEGALMTPGALGTLQRLRAIGVTVAIDDFGTGYSSLAYVRNFRADGLKIDMSFVRGLGSSIEDESIVRMILGLGQALDIRVVAEGVETSGQRDFLMQHDCDEIQGYYYARPMPAADAYRFISDFNSNRQCEAPPSWLRPTGS